MLEMCGNCVVKKLEIVWQHAGQISKTLWALEGDWTQLGTRVGNTLDISLTCFEDALDIGNVSELRRT